MIKLNNFDNFSKSDINENYQRKYVLNEEETRDRRIVKSLARRLSFDKDVIKYLNTAPGKREINWRDLLADKLHGTNANYINYITKSMVADYNVQITGYESLKAIGVDDKYGDDVRDGEENPENTLYRTQKEIEDLQDRVERIEDELGLTDNEEGSEEPEEDESDKSKEKGVEVAKEAEDKADDEETKE